MIVISSSSLHGSIYFNNRSNIRFQKIICYTRCLQYLKPRSSHSLGYFNLMLGRASQNLSPGLFHIAHV